jgi:hypothetical protein
MTTLCSNTHWADCRVKLLSSTEKAATTALIHKSASFFQDVIRQPCRLRLQPVTNSSTSTHFLNSDSAVLVKISDWLSEGVIRNLIRGCTTSSLAVKQLIFPLEQVFSSKNGSLSSAKQSNEGFCCKNAFTERLSTDINCRVTSLPTSRRLHWYHKPVEVFF